MPISSEPLIGLASPTDSLLSSREPKNTGAKQVALLAKQAETAVPNKNFEFARGLLTHALQILPEQAELLLARGFASFQVADYKSARRDFEAVVGKHPEIEAGYINLVALLFQTGLVEEALIALREGLLLHPRSLALARFMANQLFRNHQW